MTVPARSAPFILQVDVDASNVPAEYGERCTCRCYWLLRLTDVVCALQRSASSRSACPSRAS